ncbi:MAG: SGNH/GDSL hydrolase family protein [Gammaproteobacteria bacterium]|nr:SGNH/GDSL hydrolase family protein [Gammaproteobacteria bacterium]
MQSRKKLLFFLFIISQSFFPQQLWAGSGTPFKQIVFFGDSLTDNGNLYWYDWGVLPKSPPYFHGRFSNGIVWSELVSQYYHDKNATPSVNFAFGGETVLYHGPMSGYLPYNLNWSLKSYLVRTAWQDRTNALYIIWIGANDYLPGKIELDKVTTDVVKTIKGVVESLINRGGKNFIIINLPNLAKTPYGKSSPIAETLQWVSMLHNLKLDLAVAEIEAGYKHVNIQLFSINKLFDNILKHTDAVNKKYHTQINNIHEACWQGPYSFRDQQDDSKLLEQELYQHFKVHYKLNKMNEVNSKISNKFNAQSLAHFVATSPALLEAYRVAEDAENITPCTNPHEYLFWDQVHVTSQVHKMLALHAIEFIENHFNQAQ